IEPGLAEGCAPDAAACDLGTLSGTGERIVVTGYTGSLLAPDMRGPLDGPMALIVREHGLQYLGRLGWSEPLGYEATMAHLVDLAGGPRGPMVTTVKGWLVAGLPTPCPAPFEQLGEDTPFDPCPPAWLTREEVQPVTNAGGAITIREPEAGVRVQYSAYDSFAPDAALAPASGLAAPRYGIYVVRLVTDTRTGDADSGTKGWQVVGRLDPAPEIGPPDDPGPAPDAVPTPSPVASPSPRPTPTGTPQPGSIGWFSSVALSPNGRTLTITFIGGRPYDPANPCSKAYEGWAQVAGDTLYAAVVDVTPEFAVVEGASCTAEGYGRTVEVTLPEPFTGNRVQDLAGSVKFLQAPPGLAVLARLAETWQLESEGDLEGSPNGRWHRTYTLGGAQEPGRGRLDVFQAFGERETVTGGDEVHPVSVNGEVATLYRDAPTGQLVLTWSLGGDGLALMASEQDFGEAALIALAESAVIVTP
ncbi:MAG TPA: hypothetical protein VES03_01520, partial [Motilibacterales bacterium]|nr:hypothetical protein [Motilibacterales bacterium]